MLTIIDKPDDGAGEIDRHEKAPHINGIAASNL
jgi:hypothetical protein